MRLLELDLDAHAAHRRAVGLFLCGSKEFWLEGRTFNWRGIELFDRRELEQRPCLFDRAVQPLVDFALFEQQQAATRPTRESNGLLQTFPSRS